MDLRFPLMNNRPLAEPRIILVGLPGEALVATCRRVGRSSPSEARSLVSGRGQINEEPACLLPCRA